MMNRYFFVLGRSAALSAAEIIAVLKSQDIPFQVLHVSQETLIISTTTPVSHTKVMTQLGGCVKIGKIVSEVNLEEDEETFSEALSLKKLLSDFFEHEDKKLHFGISVYHSGGEQRLLKKLIHHVPELNATIKERLKNGGIKSGFVRNKERFLSSVSVVKNKLLSQGAEIVVLLSPVSILIGKTLAVQDFEAFSIRDMQRPAKDKRSGIMPPKLARMMINIAAKPTNATLLDPFCGSGTVIQEALLLGYDTVIGADVSKRAIDDSKKNLEWLKHRYLHTKITNIRLFVCDVRSISQHVPKQSIDTIVTEPYLGPPFHKAPHEREVQQIIKELETLYFAAFTQFRLILKTDGTVVIICPTFRIQGKIYALGNIENIKSLGFRQSMLLPEEMVTFTQGQHALHHSILYEGDFQYLQREIFAFQKYK